MNPNRIPKPATSFILRSTVNGAVAYLGKGGAVVTDRKQAARFSRTQVQDMASMLKSDTNFIVTPVAR
jgi:hypothetical protein